MCIEDLCIEAYGYNTFRIQNLVWVKVFDAVNQFRFGNWILERTFRGYAGDKKFGGNNLLKC